MSLGGWFGASQPTEAEIRYEIWLLGTRHHGWPLEGALQELEDGDLPPARAQLLRKCVARLQR